MAGKNFQEPTAHSDLAGALLDVLRVGLSGDVAGVRQLGRRLIRRTPADIGDVSAFRQAVGELLAKAPAVSSVAFRSMSAELAAPVDDESQLPLVEIRETEEAQPPVLPPSIASRIDEVIDERLRQEELDAHGLAPTRTLLLSGPPGVGKTMAATFIASSLHLPLVAMDLASLMSSFLGRTGQNLKTALRFAQSRPCVVLLDEFDALAKRRDDEADVGELKRLVNVLLLELERWPGGNLLVAATNHPELLDRAVYRRFDRIVELPLPAVDERFALLRLACTSALNAEVAVPDEVLRVGADMTEGMSGSDLTRIANVAARKALLRGGSLERHVLEEALAVGGVASRGPARDAFCGVARELLGYSDRQIAALLNISHPTVAKAVQRWRTTERNGRSVT